jgi:hypothetical protein
MDRSTVKELSLHSASIWLLLYTLHFHVLKSTISNAITIYVSPWQLPYALKFLMHITSHQIYHNLNYFMLLSGSKVLSHFHAINRLFSHTLEWDFLSSVHLSVQRATFIGLYDTGIRLKLVIRIEHCNRYPVGRSLSTSSR